MREVEVKAALHNRAAVEAQLRELGATLSSAKRQEDVIYVRRTGTIETFLSNDLFLRLRRVNDEHTIFTAKYHPGRTASSDQVAFEHETVVESGDTIREIITLLDFNEAVRITKTRHTARIGEYEVCLDEVEGLGAFIEVEKMIPDDEDADRVLQELETFLATLGVPAEDITTMRYDTMLLTQGGSST